MEKPNILNPYYTHIPTLDALTFRAMQGDSKVALSAIGSPYSNTFYYRLKNSSTWLPYTLGNYIDLSFGLSVSFSGTSNQFSKNGSNYYKFMTSGGGLDILGDIGSLISKSNLYNNCYQQMFLDCLDIVNASRLVLTSNIMYDNCYRAMFGRSYTLLYPPLLPATTLAPSCYFAMFNGCSSLIKLPDLPATILASGCYKNMFISAAISSIPENYLPATTLAQECYYAMFKNCSNLTFIPLNLLPATTLAYNCYQVMFYGCASLTSTPSLPATELAPYCYYQMFRGCEGLTTPPSILPAKNLTLSCYSSLFYQCTSLTSAPLLPATGLAEGCYSWMFYHCDSLSTAPMLPYITTLEPRCYRSMFAHTSISSIPFLLPATTLADHCYEYMFQDCKKLSSVDLNLLPATNLAHGCYQWMFSKCTSLTAAPSLPATELATWCYAAMFVGCTSLTSAPYLPATTLASGCYQQMFNGCTNLDSLSVNFTDWNLYILDPSGRFPTSAWLSSVAPNGTFYKPYALSTKFDLSHIPTTWNIVTENITEDDCLTFKSNGATTICLSAVLIGNSVGLDPIELRYKKNNGSWTNYEINSSISLVNGDEVRFSGANDHFSKRYGANYADRDTYTFITTGTDTLSAYGNIMSLCNFDKVIRNDHQFASLFMYSRQLVDISHLLLPVMKLSYRCYWCMFSGCKSLTAVFNQLPATTLAVECYAWMFTECISLSSISQNFLPATTLANGCYRNMFTYCSSLLTPPTLPVTTLYNACYSWMFYNCSSLTSININFTEWTVNGNSTLNWVSGVAPSGIFFKPYALETIVDLSHIPCGWIVLNRANFMGENPLTFVSNGNTIVSLVKVGLPDPIIMYYSKNGGDIQYYTIGNSISLADGLYVAFKGTTLTFSKDDDNYYLFTTNGTGTLTLKGNIQSLVNNSNSLVSDQQGHSNKLAFLFYNCTRIKDASQLLLPYTSPGYKNMFNGCSSLTTPPLLPATKLLAWSYAQMFRDCTSLTSVPDLSKVTSVREYSYYNMFRNCTSLSSVPSNLLPATTIRKQSYSYMFCGCTALTSVPIINATTLNLSYNCARMFMGCTALSTVPSNLLSAATTLAPSCYYAMFSGCTNLTSLPNLSASTLADSCYANMFAYCTSLTSTPQISATTLANSCYASMFMNCTSLSTAPELPATTLAYNCYNSMFCGCSKLSSAPSLPATTLANNCYYQMFDHCSSLINVPSLPASTIADYCYTLMFRDCTSISSIPENLLPAKSVGMQSYASMFNGCTSISSIPNDLLPASSLAYQSYNFMFAHCTSLTDVSQLKLPITIMKPLCYRGMFYCCYNLQKAPYLPAPTVVDGCYDLLFYACHKLNTISANFTSWNESSIYNDKTPTNNWVPSVAANGTFYKPFALSTIHDSSHIPTNWTVVLRILPLTFKAVGGDAKICLSAVGDPDYVSLDASYDDNNDWHSYSLGTVITLTNGQSISFSGNNDHFSKDLSNYYQFYMTGYVEASGNIQSLVNYSHLITTTHIFLSLFRGCSSLITLPLLPASKVGYRSYHCMFSDCTSLTSIPLNYLPAITTHHDCYNGMFRRCTGLSSLPKSLFPKTTTMAGEGWRCYIMFSYCSHLTAVPENFLPETNLRIGDYGAMFANCTALKIVPSTLLPATKLANSCYWQMFQNCTSLTSAPFLPATSLSTNCYNQMFYNCPLLSSISANFIDWGDSSLSATYNWVSGVANNGTFYKSPLLLTIKDASHIPTNWNVVDDTKLTFRAYGGYTTVTLSAINNPAPITMYYAKNGGALQPYTINEQIILADGLTVSFSGSTLNFSTRLTSYQFVTNGNNSLDVYGNIASLINNEATINQGGIFFNLFANIRNLKNASGLILPYLDLSNYSYMGMFYGCTSLTSVPVLPATTLGRGCYNNMFRNCINLTSAPVLPATIGERYCYADMFNNCSSLINAPIIHITQPTEHCYYQMFKGCASLTSIEVDFTDWGDSSLSATLNWVSGITNIGTFTKPSTLSTTFGESYIPQGWTVILK